VRRSKDRKDEPQSRPPNQRREPVDEAAERLATIVDAAQRAAEQVIDDAEARARQILAEADAEAERVRGEAIAAVERARRELGALSSAPPAEPEEPGRANHLSAVPAEEPPAPVVVAAPVEPEPAPAPVQPLAQRGTPAGARLLATQMAVSGSSREEIEARLRSGFEIEDTAAILDAILGPEG
jgi:cell division septum initiation protein DivIVA